MGAVRFLRRPPIFFFTKNIQMCKAPGNGRFSLSKNLSNIPRFLYNKGNGGAFMEKWKKDVRKEAMVVDIDMLVPKTHLLRKIEKVMDYDWLYEKLEPYYCHDNGRPGTDPVVLIKMVLIQHLFGIPSLRQTWREIESMWHTGGFWGITFWTTYPILRR